MEWDTTQPIRYLPENIRTFYIEQAKGFLRELETSRLEIELIPAPIQKFHGHKIRQVVSENPEWYKEIYHQYSLKRKYTHSKTKRQRTYLDSLINRPVAKNSLTRIKNQRDKYATLSSKFRADFIFRNFIHDTLLNGDFDYEQGIDIPAENRVREFFELDPIDYPFIFYDKVPF